MKSNQSKESRRKLLKSIAAGSGAIVAGKSLPEEWKKPVVDSVMLPAHAQTSPTAPCTLPQTIPSASVDCSQAPYIESRFYAIRTAASPCGFQVLSSSTAPSFPYIRVVISAATGADITLTSFNAAGIQESGNYGATAVCFSVNNGIAPLPITAYDENDNAYTVSGSFTATGGVVTMTGLTITPV